MKRLRIKTLRNFGLVYSCSSRNNAIMPSPHRCSILSGLKVPVHRVRNKTIFSFFPLPLFFSSLPSLPLSLSLSLSFCCCCSLLSFSSCTALRSDNNPTVLAIRPSELTFPAKNPKSRRHVFPRGYSVATKQRTGLCRTKPSK